MVEYAKNVNADYIMLNEDNLPSWVLNEIMKKELPISVTIDKRESETNK